MLKNIYTGPDDVMFYAKPNLFATVSGNQAVSIDVGVALVATSTEKVKGPG